MEKNRALIFALLGGMIILLGANGLNYSTAIPSSTEICILNEWVTNYDQGSEWRFDLAGDGGRIYAEIRDIPIGRTSNDGGCSSHPADQTYTIEISHGANKEKSQWSMLDAFCKDQSEFNTLRGTYEGKLTVGNHNFWQISDVNVPGGTSIKCTYILEKQLSLPELIVEVEEAVTNQDLQIDQLKTEVAQLNVIISSLNVELQTQKDLTTQQIVLIQDLIIQAQNLLDALKAQ